MEMEVTRRAQVFIVMVLHAHHRTQQVQIPVLILLQQLRDIIVVECTRERQPKQEEIRIGNQTYINTQL